MRILVAATAVIGLLGGAATLPLTAQATPNSAVTQGVASFEPAPIAWGSCEDEGLVEAGGECGMLEVPLDYAKPEGTKIKVAVSRIRHTVADDKYQGVMLVNPGGPGGSGLGLATIGQFVPDKVGASYDWIGFDPRGVGSSEPSLSCDHKYFGYKRPPYVPQTKKIENAWLKKAAKYAKACDTKGGALLDHIKTTDVVADMESIRKALGREQINFYGFSYGTYLAQVYATLHPERVRRMVLDGNVDPRGVWYQANLQQNVAFDKNADKFFAWVAKNHKVYKLGKTAKKVKKTYYAQLAKLGRKPAGKVIGPAEWSEIFVPVGYHVYAWPGRAKLFSDWVRKGSWKPLKAEYDGPNPGTPGSDNGYAVYLAVQCTDAAWPQSWATWRTDNRRLHAKHPFLTWGNAWYNAPCLNWGAAAGTPVTVDGAKAPAILLISESHDAATPFSGSLEVRSRFPKSALIEGVGGYSHSTSLWGEKCVDDAIAKYLASGKLPKRVSGRKSDKKCTGLKPPKATAAGVAARAYGGHPDVLELIGVR